MKIAAPLFTFLFCIYTVVALAQSDQHVQWLKDNAVSVRSVSPDDTDFSDLQALKGIIGEAQIVMLGEPSHGAGLSFQMKTRMVKFLHEEMGFNILAFESGLYDCEKSQQWLDEGEDAFLAIAASIFPVWAYSQEFQPLISYVGKQSGKEQPLKVTGFDCQFSSRRSLNTFLPDLTFLLDSVLKSQLTKSVEWNSLVASIEQFKQLGTKAEFSKEQIEQSERVILQIEQELDRYEGGEDKQKRQIQLWRQIIRSFKVEFQLIITPYSYKNGSIRDRQMAENLIWLSEHYYPDEKIIVWAHNFHIMRNITCNRKLRSQLQTVTMGELVYDFMKEDMYALCIVASEGEDGWYHEETSRALAKAPKKSFERYFEMTNLENAIVDFRYGKKQPSGAWLSKKQKLSPFFFIYPKYDWTETVDGIWYIREMQRSNRIEQEKIDLLEESYK